MINRSAYVPIRHPTMDNYYRTPVWVEPDYYTVCIAENVHRYYTNKTVPKEVKVGVAMVNAFPFDNKPIAYMQDVYVCPDPKQVEIGWRVDDKMYILVLDDECLRDMYIKGIGNG